MQRELKPELLDSLPPDHPDALHNRRDLRIINRVMGNYRWTARQLAGHPGRALEIGAGTGELGTYLASRHIVVDGLDLWPRAPGWPASSAWHQADLLRFDGYADYATVAGNLIFHQFTDGQLAQLGTLLRRTCRLIVACEPLRRRSSQVLFTAVAPLCGANYVSLHDGRVSIAAGFRDHELPEILGLNASEWVCECHSTVLGAYRMVARRV